MRILWRLAATGLIVAGPAVLALALALTAGLWAGTTHAGCAPGVARIPDRLTATTADGVRVELDRRQLSHAATIVRTAAATEDVGRDGVLVALMAALTESRLRMLANTTAWPQSAGFPHDGDGADHDSLGLFQMRPLAGWGSVAQLMDPGYQAAAFFGGPDGPNHGSPPGLLDIPGWRDMPKGAAAQTVEVSAHPDRYAAYEPVAESILTALTEPTLSKDATPSNRDSSADGGSGLVFPLPEGSWRRTSGFGHRYHPKYHTWLLHAGTDYAAPAGTPVLALADGVVTDKSWNDRSGNLLVLDHQIDGQQVSTAYAHLLDGSLTVAEGDRVATGQQIAAVGTTGASTGPHLHFEVHPGGFYHPIDPEPWLAGHHLTHRQHAAPAACTPGDTP
ncbi:M23 family metallopeptidase [Myceligenerans pegani]|uniref:M23 family metallopeptidase n=1 Tax=Myceligenerans pegani TaxID=2776917 RepID=A0ABR9N5R0_9MICO|nr:M23 family metallopeptidase [Myceligenerans sp. TRM 65318]MBE1878983.1 M23 family metallopeptidase [Myceligenerans sp. TRM 65318]MBE3021254.1 M23 family metallopeptidase [Myceligenerans sp. TRM 65318]